MNVYQAFLSFIITVLAFLCLIYIGKMIRSLRYVMTNADIEVERWADWFGRALTPIEERRLRELISKRDIARGEHDRRQCRESLTEWERVYSDLHKLKKEMSA